MWSKKSDYKIYVIGSDGIPNRYGGFETLASELYVDGVFHIVSSSYKRDKSTLLRGNGVDYVNLPSTGFLNVLYDSVSLIKAFFSKMPVVILGSTLSPLIVLFIFRKNVALNIGGLDWDRVKWNRPTRLLLKFAEKMSVRSSHLLVGDNYKICEYLQEEYGRKSIYIPYGVKYPKIKKQYSSEFLSILRIQKDNNIETLLEAFTEVTNALLVIGNWQSSSFGRSLRERYRSYSNITLLDPIYDVDEISAFRSGCEVYIHPHSAGGTNPSLLEIMIFNKPILAFNNGFNNATLEGQGYFWSSKSELVSLIKSELVAYNYDSLVNNIYNWDYVRDRYKSLFVKKE